MQKSTVRTDAARTRRRPEDDNPNAPVAQRASRTYRRQQALKLPDVRTDTEEPIFYDSQGYDRLAANPGGRVRRQDGERRPVTKPGGKRRGEGEYTTDEYEEQREPHTNPSSVFNRPNMQVGPTTDEQEDREPHTNPSRVKHKQSRKIDRVGLLAFSSRLKTFSRPLLIAFVIIMTIIVVACATTLFFVVSDAVSDYHNLLTYGPIPTSRVVGVFSHNDDADHQTTIIATNTNGTLIFYEIPGGDASKTTSYTPTFRLVGKNVAKLPLILKISDLNGDNRPDILVTIPGQSVSFQLINNGGNFTLKTIQG